MSAPEDDQPELPGAGRLLAVDPGSVRTGLALSDPGQGIASPLDVLPAARRPQLAQLIAEVAAREEAVGILVGLPVSLDGRLGPQAQGVRKLVRAIRCRTPVPVVTLDERYTSQAASAALAEAGIRASDRRGKVDKVAAAILLQAFLDARSRSG